MSVFYKLVSNICYAKNSLSSVKIDKELKKILMSVIKHDNKNYVCVLLSILKWFCNSFVT